MSLPPSPEGPRPVPPVPPPDPDEAREQLVACGVIKPRSRAQPCLSLPLRREMGGTQRVPKSLLRRGCWQALPPRSPPREPAWAHTHQWAGDPRLGCTPSGYSPEELGGKRDRCQGDRSPPLSMATAPLDRSPSVPGCSCPGNPWARLAPAPLGHPGFGGGSGGGTPAVAGLRQPDSSVVGAGGGMMCPLPRVAAPVATNLAWGKGAPAVLPPGPAASRDAPEHPVKPPGTHVRF